MMRSEQNAMKRRYAMEPIRHSPLHQHVLLLDTRRGSCVVVGVPCAATAADHSTLEVVAWLLCLCAARARPFDLAALLAQDLSATGQRCAKSNVRSPSLGPCRSPCGDDIDAAQQQLATHIAFGCQLAAPIAERLLVRSQGGLFREVQLRRAFAWTRCVAGPLTPRWRRIWRTQVQTTRERIAAV